MMARSTCGIWKPENTPKTFTGPTCNISCLSFSPDGKTIASGSDDGQMRLWDVDTGKHITTFTGQTSAFTVNSVSFSPDGKTLASAADSVWLWDIETKKHIKTLTGYTHSPNSLSFNPDGSLIASGQ